MRAFPMMRGLGAPVVFDVTHSLQLPGGGDGVTAGLAEYIEPLASAGVAAGVDGVFLEVHEDPPRAKSDAQNALRLDRLARAARSARSRIHAAVKAAVVTVDDRAACTPTVGRRSTSRARVLETEARAILGLVARLDARFEQRRGRCWQRAGAASSSPAWASRASSPQDRRDALEHRHAGVLPAPGRGAPRRPRRGPADDVVVALSYSGETEELVRLLEIDQAARRAAHRADRHAASTLGQAADVHARLRTSPRRPAR